MQSIEQQITSLIEETLTIMGFELVVVRLRGLNYKILEILIDRLDGEKVTIEDCRQVSQNISAILDVEDIIDDAYNLEVSSSGTERPLVKFADYNRFSGREVNIKLKALLNGKTRYQGKIIKAEDDKVYVNLKGEELVIDFNLIKDASLVLTDEMFKELLGKKFMSNIGNVEILQIIDSVAREKGISKENLISAVEQAVQVAGRKKYGNEYNIKAQINKKTGEINLLRVLEIVEEVEDYLTQISLKDALEKTADAKIGDEIYEYLPPIDHARVAAQAAKQVIAQRMVEAEREKQYYDFKDRKGEIINGVIKRIEYGDVFVDLGRTEAIIKREQLIRGESFKINDRVKAYVQDVRLEAKGPQIFLSRTDNQMLIKLFELEVPEIYDNIIEIKAVARDPGSKAKIAVFASDTSIDPVGSCVGIRGNRVRAVTNELNGEKIDIVLWTNNVAQFVINALAPAEITKILIDEDKRRVEVVVSRENQSIAIGRRGQNVRLASKLTGWNIDIMTEEQESKRRNDEFLTSTELFMEALDVEEVIAQLLSVTGFTSVEQIANSEVDSLTAIEGFEEELAIEIKKRANDYVDIKNEKIVKKLEDLGVEQELIDILELQPDAILKFAEYGIKTIEDLGEVSLNEFKTLAPDSNVTDENIKLLIKTARQHGEFKDSQEKDNIVN